MMANLNVIPLISPHLVCFRVNFGKIREITLEYLEGEVSFMSARKRSLKMSSLF